MNSEKLINHKSNALENQGKYLLIWFSDSLLTDSSLGSGQMKINVFKVGQYPEAF